MLDERRAGGWVADTNQSIIREFYLYASEKATYADMGNKTFQYLPGCFECRGLLVVANPRLYLNA